MSTPRKPIFGFLWPSADPDAPVDEAYRQVRRVRICPRGPVRLAALLTGTALTAMAMGSVIMAALAAPMSALVLVGSAVLAAALVATLRGWVVGTYVNDDGLLVETLLRRVAVPWEQVRAITAQPACCPFLGTPLRRTAIRLLVETTDGRTVPTHVYQTSPDLWLRAEAFDMARLRLERWAPGSR